MYKRQNQEMGTEDAEAENVNADINFCDEQLVKDLVDRRVAAEKIAAKWVLGFVKSRLNDADVYKRQISSSDKFVGLSFAILIASSIRCV